MAFQRTDLPVNPRVTLRDLTGLTALPTTTSFTPLTDSGTENIFVGTTSTWPQGVSGVNQNHRDTDRPYNAYDVRGCRAFSVQVDSYNLATASTTFQLQASNDGLGYTAIWLYSPSTGVYTSAFTLPSGGTVSAPNSTLLLVTNPWFAWLQLKVTTADTASNANAFLSIMRRT